MWKAGMSARNEAQLLASTPLIRETTSSAVRDAIALDGRIVVVLDDDPTGTQTVADVPVLTAWSVPDIRWALRQGASAVYVLTNSRSLDPSDAAARTREVLDHVAEAARAERVGVVVTSRSDSTLRGHFPLETDIAADCLEEFLGETVDAIVLVPAYVEAGRVTIDSVHYARQGVDLVPVGETEFARDASFAYAASDLRDFVAEKTQGRWAASQVARITLDDIRVGGAERVAELLAPLHGRQPVVVDATCDDDLRVVSLGLLAAEGRGQRFVYRSGPSFVRARAGLDARAALGADEIRALRRVSTTCVHGLVVVGSHVSMSTRHLNALLGEEGIRALEVDVPSLLRPDEREARIADVVATAVASLADNDVVVGTSRELTRGADAQESLAIARAVSSALSEIVRRVVAQVTPSWVVAKGGITSSDVATEGLGSRRAWARGTLLPGIISLWEPVVETGDPIPYVVFAGNVGDEHSLVSVVRTLRGSI